MLITPAAIQAQAHRKRSGNIGTKDQESDEEWSIRSRNRDVLAKLHGVQLGRMMLMRQKCIAGYLRHGNRRNRHDGEVISVCLL